MYELTTALLTLLSLVEHDTLTTIVGWFGGIFCAGIVVLICLKRMLAAGGLSVLTLALALLTLHMLS